MADKKESTRGYTNILNEIIELKIPPLEKTILIVLLRYYNEKKGYSYPSYSTLTEKCYITKKTLVKGLNNLEEKGFIKKECVKGKGNKYFILVENLHQCKNYTSVEITPHWCKNYTTLVENLHPTNTNINTNTITNNKSNSKELDDTQKAFKDSIDTNKNTNSSKKKNKKDYSNEIKEIIEYLNLKANKNYKHTTSSYKKMITARLEEKYSVDDFKKVIDHKAKEWSENEKMKNYLRPGTLFAPSHFDEYLNQAIDTTKKEESQKGRVLSVEEMMRI